MTQSTDDRSSYVRWFRSAAPYVNAHRARTFVIYAGHRAVGSGSFPGIVQDVALLATLGVRVVLVYGIDSVLEGTLRRHGAASERSHGDNGKPNATGAPGATGADTMAHVLDVAGKLRFEIEARLSMALANVPLAHTPIRVASGNFIHARPAGVLEGRDLELAGELRRVDAEGISRVLGEGHVVLLPPVGYSPSGELFRLDAQTLAGEVAIALRAAKLIALEDDLVLATQGRPGVRELTLQGARAILATRRALPGPLSETERLLEQLANACRLGVQRGHLLDARVDGALVLELFTRDGIGTMVAMDVYDDTRRARSEDVAGIVELIEPLERSGALVRRPREKLEREIEQFLVMERDGTVVACAAIYPVMDAQARVGTDLVELACLAVHPAYRKSDRGDALLRRAEQEARTLGATRLLVLTTQAEHWFVERGFERASIDALPAARKETYNFQRNSKVLVKSLRQS